MPELQVGRSVRVISCCDTHRYDGREGILAKIDLYDLRFTYRVDFENGDYIWAQIIEPVSPISLQ